MHCAVSFVGEKDFELGHHIFDRCHRVLSTVRATVGGIRLVQQQTECDVRNAVERLDANRNGHDPVSQVDPFVFDRRSEPRRELAFKVRPCHL